MKQYNKTEYISKFGADMWRDKVININDGADVESVYATDAGNIFMIMNA